MFTKNHYRSDFIHGKTHKATVPIKVIRATNDKRSADPDMSVYVRVPLLFRV